MSESVRIAHVPSCDECANNRACVCERGVCPLRHGTEDDLPNTGGTGTSACYKCKGGEWGCPDFKVGKDSTTFKCDCSKKASGSCKYNEYDGICVDPGYEVSGGGVVRAPWLFGLVSAAVIPLLIGS